MSAIEEFAKMLMEAMEQHAPKRESEEDTPEEIKKLSMLFNKISEVYNEMMNYCEGQAMKKQNKINWIAIGAAGNSVGLAAAGLKKLIENGYWNLDDWEEAKKEK